MPNGRSSAYSPARPLRVRSAPFAQKAAAAGSPNGPESEAESMRQEFLLVVGQEGERVRLAAEHLRVMLQRRLVVEVVAMAVGIEIAEDDVVVIALLVVTAGAEALHEGAVEQRPGRGDAAVEPREMVEVEFLDPPPGLRTGRRRAARRSVCAVRCNARAPSTLKFGKMSAPILLVNVVAWLPSRSLPKRETL